jgi:TadE-like protein
VRRRAGEGCGRQGGQAAVELVALLPALVVVGLLGWQIAVAAHGWLSAGGAARAAARAEQVGAPADAAARAALGARDAAAARVEVLPAAGGREVRVRLALPGVVPGLPGPGWVEGAAVVVVAP